MPRVMTVWKTTMQQTPNKAMCQPVPRRKQDPQARGRSSYIFRRTQTANEPTHYRHSYGAVPARETSRNYCTPVFEHTCAILYATNSDCILLLHVVLCSSASFAAVWLSLAMPLMLPCHCWTVM